MLEVQRRNTYMQGDEGSLKALMELRKEVIEKEEKPGKGMQANGDFVEIDEETETLAELPEEVS